MDTDAGAILVFGKGRRDWWMPLGNQPLEALWDYTQARELLAKRTRANTLWVEIPVRL